MQLRVPFYWQINNYACGPAVLQMLLKFYGISRSQKNLMKLAKTNKRVGTTRRNLVLAFKKFDLNTTVVFPSELKTIQEYLKKKMPVIVSYLELDSDQEHFSVIIGMTKKDLVFQDPWLGEKYQIDRKNFLLRWHNSSRSKKYRGWLLVVSQTQKPGILKRIPLVIRDLVRLKRKN